MLLNIVAIIGIIYQFVYTMFFYKKYHSKYLRLINSGILILFFSICFGQYSFGHLFTVWSLIFIVTTILLQISLYIFLNGLLEYQFGTILFTIVNTITYVGSSIKLATTGAPVVWSDFNNGLFWEVVWNMYLKQDYLYIILCFIVLAICFFILYKQKFHVFNFQLRLARVLLGGISFVTTVILIGNLFVSNVHSKSFNEQGSLIYFISSYQVDPAEISEISSQYSEKKMDEIVKKYQAEFSDTDKFGDDNETVITILSEAFSDPETFSGVKWKEDPMPNFRKLQRESGGYLQTSIFGGGTTNTEFSILTGFSYAFFNPQVNAFDYLSQHKELSQSIAQYKSDSIAVHTHFKTGYHRSEVLPNLGFSKFIGREDILKSGNPNKEVYYKEGLLSDDTFFKQLLLEVNSNTSQNLLVHGMSMQNHYPFTETAKGKLNDKEVLIAGNKLDSEQKQLALYARGINETDQALGTFIKSLEAMDRNVTVVMYGDHYPALNNSVYAKYPVKNDKNKNINDHSTPYFVWKNHNRKSKYVRDVMKPEGLSALEVEEGNSKVPVFYQFISKINNSLGAKKYTDTNSMTKEQKELVNDYQLIQYDMLQGKQYSKILFKKPVG